MFEVETEQTSDLLTSCWFSGVSASVFYWPQYLNQSSFSFRASITKDPFYDLVSARKRKLASNVETHDWTAMPQDQGILPAFFDLSRHWCFEINTKTGVKPRRLLLKKCLRRMYNAIFALSWNDRGTESDGQHKREKKMWRVIFMVCHLKGSHSSLWIVTILGCHIFSCQNSLSTIKRVCFECHVYPKAMAKLIQ